MNSELLRVARELRDCADDISALSAQLVSMAEEFGKDVENTVWAFPVGNDEYPPAAWYAATHHDTSGRRNNGYAHTGIDLNLDRHPWGDVDRGQPVFAVTEGVVRAVAYSTNYLGSVVIEVEHGGKPLFLRYWHLMNDKTFKALAEWQTVQPSECLGHLGNYQMGGGGDHLHFDCALDNFGAHWWFSRHSQVRWIDPVPVLKDHLDPVIVNKMLTRNAG